MARVAGITTEKDLKGNITKVTFDFKKYGSELMPILLKTGMVEEDSFEKEWAEAEKTGYTVEEFKDAMLKTVRSFEWKK